MALVSFSIPNMINGISQQPDSIRLPSQGEAQENCYSSVVEGLMRRPPTKNVNKIIDGTLANAFLHSINRDVNERYVVVVTNGDLKVFDIAGNEKTVAFPDGKSYLSVASPSSSFRAVTIADYTFIVNKTKVTAMDSTLSTNRGGEALVFVKKGHYGSNYKVNIDGTEQATYTTSATNAADLKTDAIAEDLKSDLVTNLGVGWTITRAQSVVWIDKDDASAFDCGIVDSQGGESLVAIQTTVQKFTDLPAVAPDAFVVGVEGDPEFDEDNYFVKADVINGQSFDACVWKETIKPGIKYKFDLATMPHVLVRESDGTFTFKKGTWADRLVGDEASNAEPSFIGSAISDIFFFKGRLAFLADDNVIFSETSSYFNFWRTTVTNSLDSDPIDYAASHTKVSVLRHAIAFQEKILLFSDQTQFVGKADGPLTAKTFRLDPTTEYESNTTAKPIGVGRGVMFVTNKGNYNGLREYLLNEQTLTEEAADITGHIPKYIPAGVFKLTTSTVEDMVAVITTGDPDAIYVYKQFYGPDGAKLQSSWSRWTFGTGTTALNAEFIDNTLYIVIQRADGVYIESLLLAPGVADTNQTFITHLDQRITEASTLRLYDTPTNKTTYYLPYPASASLRLITRDDGGGQDVGIQLATPTVLSTQEQWGTALWSHSGLNAYDGTKVNDGDTGTAAFETDTADATAYLKLDLGSGVSRPFLGVSVTVDGAVTAIWDVQYSDNDSDWTTAYTGLDMSGGSQTKTVKWAYKGSHRYWRLKKTNAAAAGAAHTEVQFLTEKITLSGDKTTTPVYIGYFYESMYEFSKQYLRKGNQAGGSTTITFGRLQIRSFGIVYSKTGYFRVEVTPNLRPTSTYKFTGHILGDGGNTFNNVSLPSGQYRIPIMSRNDAVVVRIKSDSFLPFHFLNVDVEGEFSARSKGL